MANKVLFGFSDLYIGTYTVGSGGAVTMGSPYHQKGAVGFSPEPSNDENNFRADNINYYTSYGTGARSGDLEVAMFDKQVKTDYMGYVELDDGGLAEIKNAAKTNIYIMFEVQGDEAARRIIFYNGKMGPITRNYNTTDETIEPVTETVPVNFVGDNETGITMVTYEQGDSGYESLFTNPPAPELPSL